MRRRDGPSWVRIKSLRYESGCLSCNVTENSGGNHTAKRIFERLRDEYGFSGQPSISSRTT